MKNVRKILDDKLSGARFRLLTSFMTEEKNSKRITNPVIKDYHVGYRAQVKKWAVNPLDIVIEYLKEIHEGSKIADIGCGEALISQKIENVTSIDLFPVNESILKADLDNLPLEDKSFDVAVYCLSLLKKNVFKTITEANRILKVGGELVITETKSRIEVNEFIKRIKNLGFKVEQKRDIEDFFYFLVFKKIEDKKITRGEIQMKEFVYKKR